MSAPPHHVPAQLLHVFENPQVVVGLLTAGALLIEVLLLRYVLEASPSMFVVLGPLWIFSVYKVSGRRDRVSNVVTSIAVVVVAAAVVLGSGF